jgi:hypothetical protein
MQIWQAWNDGKDINWLKMAVEMSCAWLLLAEVVSLETCWVSRTQQGLSDEASSSHRPKFMV